ncbi:peptide chain release factor 1 [Candidatus Woesearchaeota archaeon]|nr:MAG: peptide chain release factor 1 [Candidatus Woesearchaeota archaeon]
MTLSDKDKFKLRKIIKELSGYRGRHTELVTVYVPAGYDLNGITTQLMQEAGTATNIKSKQTRDNVIGALEKMIQAIKAIPKTPPNGLALFSGNVSDNESKDDFRVWVIEPPEPLNQKLYKCDKVFELEPLEAMCATDDVYGLVVFDRRDADVALLKGKTIIPLQKTHSEVPGKHKTGGQSAQRFERLREGATIDHFKKIAEMMKNNFLNLDNLRGIIIGGPSGTVERFLEKDYVTGDLKKKILGAKHLSYTGSFGLQELLEKSEDLLASESVAREKMLMQKFLSLLAKEPGKTSYGKAEVKKMLEMGAVETLLLSESLDDSTIEEFTLKAEEMGSEVELISVETREGVQLKELGGVAAILRYDAGM